MPRYAKRAGQVGDYWLTRRPNSPAWCRTWFDRRGRQVRRASLGTDDFAQAFDALVAWYLKTHRPQQAMPADLHLSTVLTGYYDRHAAQKPSAAQAMIAIKRFLVFWRDAKVSILTRAEQDRYVKARREGKVAVSTISRELSILRAALMDAVNRQELASAPAVIEIETAEDRRARKPKGRPLSLDECAALIRASLTSERRMMFLMILFGTLCRPAAARDLTAFQHEAGLVHLNPPGRRQTTKYRPTIPVAEFLAPWLSLRTRGHYVGYLSRAVGSTRTMWRQLRRAAGLDVRVQPYSIRHTMARELRKRRVPQDQIEIMLGHRRPDHGTTGIYAPYDPSYCVDAVTAIDAVMREIEGKLGLSLLVAFQNLASASRRDAQRRENAQKMVGATGIEPVTPTMSKQRA